MAGESGYKGHRAEGEGLALTWLGPFAVGNSQGDLL